MINMDSIINSKEEYEKFWEEFNQMSEYEQEDFYIGQPYIWFEWDLKTKEELEDAKTSSRLSKTAKEIIDEVISLLGQKVTYEGDIYTLDGLQITNEDLYWILKNQEGQVSYGTCVGGIEKC